MNSINAIRAATNVFGDLHWTVVGDPLNVFDAAGPLLFIDFQLRGTEVFAWTRFFPALDGALVSVEHGLHPILKYLSTHSAEQTEPIELVHLTKRPLLPNIVEARRIQEKFGWEIQTLMFSRFYCYHYPNLAILRQDSKGQAIFLDLDDGTGFPLSESGNGDTSESRAAYSFLAAASEGGAPGPINVPAPAHSIIGELYGQQRENWCAAAACEMILKFHQIDVSQEHIATDMHIPIDAQDGGAPIDNQIQTYREFLSPDRSVVVDTNPTAQSCIDELAANRPLKIGIFKHAQACFGWIKSGDDVLYDIYDPMPIGEGVRKWQNPAVIWTQNHIYVR